jgi:hypothetical protein
MINKIKTEYRGLILLYSVYSFGSKYKNKKKLHTQKWNLY